MANGQDPALLQQEEQLVPAEVEQETAPVQEFNSFEYVQSLGQDELMKLKHFVKKRREMKEVTSNVGGDRALELFNIVKEGKMTLQEAVKRSAKERSVPTKDVDKLYYTEGVTSQDLLNLKNTKGHNWTTTEHSNWSVKHNAMLRQENAVRKQEVIKDNRLSVQQRKNYVTQSNNFEHLLNTQTIYTNIEDMVYRAMKPFYLTDKLGRYVDPKGNLIDMEKEGYKMYRRTEGKKAEIITEKNATLMWKNWDIVKTEMGKDLNEFGTGDDRTMKDALLLISNTIPLSHLRTRLGFQIGESWTETIGRTPDEITLRKAFYDELNTRLTNARKTLSNLRHPYTGTPPPLEQEQEQGQDPAGLFD